MRVDYREEPCRTALSRVRGMPFRWSLNPYTGCEHRCAFCYVRAFELRADRPGDWRYGRSIRVKINIAAVLRRELARRSWQRELVVVGSATDPYQPAEGRYRLTRACLVELARARTPVRLITRGTLVVRDIDVLQHAARRGGASVTVSISTLDEAIWTRTEPGTPPPRQRLRALRMLVDAGIEAGVAIAPILPGLTDDEERLADVVREAREAGAAFLWAKALNLQPGAREHFFALVEREWPELLSGYRRLYRRAWLPSAHAREMQARALALRDEYAIADRRESPLLPVPAPRQLALL